MLKNTNLYNHYLMRRLTQKPSQLGWVSGYHFVNRKYTTDRLILNNTKFLTLTNVHRLGIQTPGQTQYYKKTRHLQNLLIGPTILKYNYVGKSYRVRFNDGVLFLRFNRAHRTTLFYNRLAVTPQPRRWFKISLRWSERALSQLQQTLRYVRPRNVFTQRGLWCRRDFFYKKRGKVSAYR